MSDNGIYLFKQGHHEPEVITFADDSTPYEEYVNKKIVYLPSEYYPSNLHYLRIMLDSGIIKAEFWEGNNRHFIYIPINQYRSVTLSYNQ